MFLSACDPHASHGSGCHSLFLSSASFCLLICSAPWWMAKSRCVACGSLWPATRTPAITLEFAVESIVVLRWSPGWHCVPWRIARSSCKDFCYSACEIFAATRTSGQAGTCCQSLFVLCHYVAPSSQILICRRRFDVDGSLRPARQPQLSFHRLVVVVLFVCNPGWHSAPWRIAMFCCNNFELLHSRFSWRPARQPYFPSRYLYVVAMSLQGSFTRVSVGDSEV